MAKIHGKGARVYLDEFNISGYSNAWTLNITSDTAEVTAFSDDGIKEYLEGNYDHTFDVSAWYDPDGMDSETFTEVVTEIGTTRYGALLPLGITAGNAAYEVMGKYTGRTIPADVANAIGLQHQWQGTGGVSRGQVLAGAAYTADTQTTGIDYGAKAAGTTLVVVYRVVAYTGLDSVVLTVQESSDDGSGDAYADIAATESSSFTDVGYERLTTTGATEQYLRLDVDVTGTGSCTVLATVTTLT